MDDLIDPLGASVSQAVREMACRVGIDAGSFARAAATLERVGQLQLSDESLRQIVESEGQAVVRWREEAQWELDFDLAACSTTATADGKPVTRGYVGIDGFLVPTVTDAEMGKRYEGARQRRRQRKPKPGVRRPRLVRRRGADQRYKEFKLVTLYDQDQEHKVLQVTRRCASHAGIMLKQMAEAAGLYHVQEIAAVTDGAAWIAGLVEDYLPAAKTTAILDFYHAAAQVHAARRVVYGEANPQGQAWAEQVLKGMLEAPFEAWWQPIVAARSRVRAAAKCQALDALMGYLLPRKEQLAYASFRQRGLKIGSGPTESGCKSEARRLKGIGMRWTAANAQALAALEALHQSNLWKTYWQSKTKAAA